MLLEKIRAINSVFPSLKNLGCVSTAIQILSAGKIGRGIRGKKIILGTQQALPILTWYREKVWFIGCLIGFQGPGSTSGLAPVLLCDLRQVNYSILCLLGDGYITLTGFSRGIVKIKLLRDCCQEGESSPHLGKTQLGSWPQMYLARAAFSLGGPAETRQHYRLLLKH